VTNRALTALLGRVLSRPTIVAVPWVALRAAFGEMAEGAVLSSIRAVPSRLEATGYHFRYPALEQALRHLLGR
jgi:NAD dependent epimerase/dehydratase family enzyme